MEFFLETLTECGEAFLWLGILGVAYLAGRWSDDKNQ